MTGDCVLFTGTINASGYGRLWDGLAHRKAYEDVHGPIPAGLEVDHLCFVRACVNPAHLEAVTRAENMRRRSERQQTCKNGHALTPDNTYRKPSGHRDCRACIRSRVAAYRLRQAETA